MSVHFTVPQDIAISLLKYLPHIANKNGDIAVRGDRGTLIIHQQNNPAMTSYSLLQESMTDKHGLIADVSGRIASIAQDILDGPNSKGIEYYMKSPVYENRYNTSDVYLSRSYGRDSMMFNMGNGYSLSGGSNGDLLTSSTYDGGNEVLTGGSEGYRSNYGSNRLPGTSYGDDEMFADDSLMYNRDIEFVPSGRVSNVFPDRIDARMNRMSNGSMQS